MVGKRSRATASVIAEPTATDATKATVVFTAVVRAWPGYKATFDGEFRAYVGVYAELNAYTAPHGLVLLNLEGTRSTEAPFGFHYEITMQRVISVHAHHNYAKAGAPSANYGGIVVGAGRFEANHDVEVSHCLVHHNNTDGVSEQCSDNIGGISLFMSYTDMPTAHVRLMWNDVHHECHALRDKESGRLGGFEAHHNRLADSQFVHLVRAAGPVHMHHELALNCGGGIRLMAQNQQWARATAIENMTFVKVGSVVTDADDAYRPDEQLSIRRVIFENPTSNEAALITGAYPSHQFPVEGLAASANLFHQGDDSHFWRLNETPPAAHTRAQWQAQTNDVALNVDPLFTDAPHGVYTLRADSPAAAVDHAAIGAFAP